MKSFKIYKGLHVKNLFNKTFERRSLRGQIIYGHCKYLRGCTITGKARSTIQSYIKTGRLSKTTDSHTGVVGVDTSELIRCFGELIVPPNEHVVNEQISHQTTGNTTLNTTDEIIKIAILEKEIEFLKKIIEEKDEHNKSVEFILHS